MKCPACNQEMEHDEVDIGVGNMPIGPYYCPFCQYVDNDEPEEEKENEKP